MPAHAQTIDSDCTPNQNIEAGDTINCVIADPGVITSLQVAVDDLTINVGDANTPTNLIGGIRLIGGSGTAQSINIINAASTVTHTGGNGIYAHANNEATTITSAGSVTATASPNSTGILALSDGDDGTISITAADTAGSLQGIYARTRDASITIDSAAGLVTGGQRGIRVRGLGVADITVTTAGVTGGTFGGINARTDGSITIDSSAGSTPGTVQGTYGIYAHTFNGTDAANVSVTTGNIIANTLNGVYARTNIGDVTVNTSAGSVDASRRGVRASSQISGDVLVTTAAVTSAIDIGVFATSENGTVTVNTVAGSITSERQGVYTRGDSNVGDDVTVTTADVTSYGNNGIQVRATGGLANIDSSAGTVTSYSGDGINVRNSLDTSITITTANVLSEIGDGIYARSNGGDITVNSAAGSVVAGTETTAGDHGIQARSFGGGDVSITTADVTSTHDEGIEAYSNSGIITINTTQGTVSTIHREAFDVFSRTGDIEVTTAGVTSTYGTAIRVDSDGGNIEIDTSAGEVVGSGYSGIGAYGDVAGTIVITAASSIGNIVDADNEYGSGIFAFTRANNAATPASITITTTGEVKGSYYGIYSGTRDANGTVTINVDSGTVSNTRTDDTGYGITARSEAGATITIASGATVIGNRGAIRTSDSNGLGVDVINISGSVIGDIRTNRGPDTLNLFSTGSINSTANLDTGDDVFNYEGGSFTVVDGGSNYDHVNFNAGYVLDDFTKFLNFEQFNFTLGASTLEAALTGDAVTIAQGASLDVADGASISLNNDLVNSGTLTIAGSDIGAFDLDATFIQESTGVTTVTVKDGQGDYLSANIIELDGTLNLEQTGIQTGTITLMQSDLINGEFAQVTGIASGLLIEQSIEYIDDVVDSVQLTSDVADNADNIDGLTSNQVALANALTGQLIDGDFNGDLYDYGIDLIGGETVEKLSETLDEILPQAGLGGTQIFQNAQRQFGSQLLNQAGAHSGGGSAIVQTASTNSNIVPSGFGNEATNVWGALYYNTVEGGESGAGEFDADGYGISAGVKGIDMGGVLVGAAIGYAAYEADITSVSADSVDSTLFNIGAFASKGINESGAGLNTRLDGVFSYSTGENEITQNVAAVGANPASQNTASADISGYSLTAKLTFTGSDGKDWTLKPHLSAGFDSVTQDAYTLGADTTGELSVGESTADRFSFGYGVSYEHDVGDGLFLKASARGLQHSGDTAISSSSAFAGSTATNAAFVTNSADIETEFILEGGISKITDGGWSLGVDAYTHFGDLEGFGGRVKVGHTF